MLNFSSCLLHRLISHYLSATDLYLEVLPACPIPVIVQGRLTRWKR